MKKAILFTLIIILFFGQGVLAGFNDWEDSDQAIYTVYLSLTAYEIFQAYNNSWVTNEDIHIFYDENVYSIDGEYELITETEVITETRWMNNGGQLMPPHFSPQPSAEKNFKEIEVEYEVEKEYYKQTKGKTLVRETEVTEVINTYQENDFIIAGKVITELVVAGFVYGIADGVEEQYRTPVLLAGTALKSYMIYKNNDEVKLSLYNFAF